MALLYLVSRFLREAPGVRAMKCKILLLFRDGAHAIDWVNGKGKAGGLCEVPPILIVAVIDSIHGITPPSGAAAIS